jgi:UDP-galactopyranose mutase
MVTVHGHAAVSNLRLSQYFIGVGVCFLALYHIMIMWTYERNIAEKYSIDSVFNKQYDVCCVGAGLSGGIIAERYATLLSKKVLVIEKRDHIGGNCYDHIDEETGILVNKYGAHLFHTNYERVWEYVKKFSNWTKYEHRVMAYVQGKHVPVPVNIDTVNSLFGLSIETPEEMKWWLEKETAAPEAGKDWKTATPKNSEEMAVSRVGRRLYEWIFHPYTIKQWAKEPAELGPEVTARIPVRDNYDNRYFGDKYQALPSKGYTEFFKHLLDHPLITVRTNVDFFDVRSKLKCGRTYFTGPVDAYYAHLGWEKLEYRGLDFKRGVKHNTEFLLPLSVVNYPSADVNYTRIVEYKHYLHQKSPHTVFFYEHSKDVDGDGDAYYPVPNEKNQVLYKQYQKMADKEKDTKFVGRLANYKYFNMDQSIKNALELFDKDTGSIFVNRIGVSPWPQAHSRSQSIV